MTLIPQDETAIRRLLDDYIELWGQGKAAACADLYDAAGDLLAVDGAFLRSPDEIRRYYEKVMSGKYSGFEENEREKEGATQKG